MRLFQVIFILLAAGLVVSCGDDDTGVGPDTTPPTVVATSPDSGAVAVVTNAVLSATFSENMNAGTISPATFLLSGGVGGSVAYADRVATFTPAAELTYGTTYTATITTGAKDVAGNGLAQEYSWTFTTLAADAPPRIMTTDPADSAVDIWVNTPITVTFNKPMDSATITPATFVVSGVTGTFDYDGRAVTFTPDSNLAFNTTYSVLITANVADTFGISMGDSYWWTFTTGPVRIMNGPEYFPMAPGDRWFYTTGASQQIVREVGGDTVIDGRTCTRILHNGVTAEAWSTDATGFRVHLLDAILWFVPPLLIPFDLVIDEPYAYNSDVYWIENDTLYTSNISGTLKFRGYVVHDVPAGHFDDVIRFFYLPDGYSEYYARGVGLLDNDDYVLDSAYVGGVWYR